MTTQATLKGKVSIKTKAEAEVATGPAAAAMVAGGIGTLAIGLLTTGAVISVGLKEALNFWNPAGPLTGKTAVGVIAWIITWLLLNTLWKDKDYDLNKAFTITLILISIGLLFTFPTFFEAFEAE